MTRPTHGTTVQYSTVGKYIIYHLFFVKFWGLKGKRNPKYFLDLK